MCSHDPVSDFELLKDVYKKHPITRRVFADKILDQEGAMLTCLRHVRHREFVLGVVERVFVAQADRALFLGASKANDLDGAPSIERIFGWRQGGVLVVAQCQDAKGGVRVGELAQAAEEVIEDLQRPVARFVALFDPQPTDVEEIDATQRVSRAVARRSSLLPAGFVLV